MKVSLLLLLLSLLFSIKGSARCFYDMLKDGNNDNLTLHEALPPINGSEKWMTNLWIWEPKFSFMYRGEHFEQNSNEIHTPS